MKNSPPKMDAAQRRKRVADLYLQGWTQEAIAGILDISQPTVSRDLEDVRKEWRDASTIDFDEARARELHRLNLIEREAWAAWQRSQSPLTAFARTEGGASQAESRRSTLKNSYGDPRFLDLVNKCVAQRCLLLALNPAAPAEREDPHAHESLEVRRERVLATMARLGFGGGTGDAGTRPDGAEPGEFRGDRQCGEVGAGAASGVSRPDAPHGD